MYKKAPLPVSVSWNEGKDYTIFKQQDAEGNIGICNHCARKFSNRNYLRYQHKNFCSKMPLCTKRKMPLDYYFKDSHTETDKKLIALVKYICYHGATLASTQSVFSKLVFGVSFSEETIRDAIIQYAKDIQDETRQKIHKSIVAFVIDGATINESSGWYAIGISTRDRVFIYDIVHMASTTTISLTHQINEIIDNIREETDAIVVGACSDNAPNIANVFNPTHPNGLAIVHGKYLLRISCQAHTANLVTATYERNNPYYSQLRSQIKSFATKASEKSIHTSLGISDRCPLIRDQRWFTEHDALKWIIKNRKTIEDSWEILSDEFELTNCPITDEWNQLFEALQPLRDFVANVETNVCVIGKAWEHYQKMKNSLQSISSSNKFASDLLEIVIQRWKTTADADLLHLASFVSPANHIQWKQTYASLARMFQHGGMPDNEKQMFAEMTKEADIMVSTTIKYASHMGYAFNNNASLIHFILTAANLSVNHIGPYYWHENGACSDDIACDASRQGIDTSSADVSSVCEFFCRLISLPSSEAFCERIFARMRSLFPKTRSSCNDDLVKAQTLIRVTLQLDSPSDD